MFKKVLRSEKNCLNCGHETAERYCPNCGQENVQPKLPIGDLLKEFLKQLLDIDGKFYQTLQLLFTKPGLVAKEYTSGRRKTYTHPIRLFFVFGAVFLLVFNLMVDIDSVAHEQAVTEAVKKGINVNSPEFKPLLQVHMRTYHALFGSLVYIIILSVPLFAFFSRIFLRSKHRHYYVDHMIYAVYNYVVYFIPLTLIMLFYYFLDSDNPKDNKWGLLLFMVLLISHGTVAAKRFHDYGKFRSLIAGIFQFIFLTISIIIALIAVLSILLLINYFPLEATINFNK